MTLGLTKGGHHYVVTYFDIEGKREALRIIGSWASNRELNFTWYDAALMSQKIRGSYAPSN